MLLTVFKYFAKIAVKIKNPNKEILRSLILFYGNNSFIISISN